MSMESTSSRRFLSSSSDETECYLYPMQIKTEINQKSIEKEEQKKLEKSIHCVNRYQTEQCEPMYLSERQNNQALEKQSLDMAGKPGMREFSQFQTCSNERLPYRISENKLFTKKWSPENEDRKTTEDEILLNVPGQPLERESLSVWSAANTCENLEVLNPTQAQQNDNKEQNKSNGDNELEQNSSVTHLNRDLPQMDLLTPKSVSDKKWKQRQLLQIPFLRGTSSMFSPMEHEKNNFLKKRSSTEDKEYSSCGNETSAERCNKEKQKSSYIIPTLKPFKSLQPLKIPNFLLPIISYKANSKMPSTNLKEIDWKNFKGQPSLMQSKEIYGLQKMSEIRKQKMQNNESSVRASTIGSEFKGKNYPSISKQEHSALTVAGEVSGTYIRGDRSDFECKQIFAENDFKGKMLENSDDDEDEQKSKIHIYISVRKVQNEKRVSYNDLLKRMGRKSSNENAGTFHIQTTIPVITESLEKNKLAVHCSVHNSSSDISLYEAESKISAKEILDLKRYLTKNTALENNFPHITAQNFPDKKVVCTIFRGKEIIKFKFSFQDLLFGWVRAWTESLYKDMSRFQKDSATHWFHFCEMLKEQCDAHELMKSNINRNYNNKICICLLVVISKHLKVELLKRILPFFFYSINTLGPTGGRSMQVQKLPLCGRKQDQLNSCTNNTLRQTTEFHKKRENYPGLVSSKFVESLGFELHNECQRIQFYRSLDEEESTFLKKGTLFHNQKSGLYKERRVRRHHLLSRESMGCSNYLRSVTHKNSTKKQVLLAKCLILLQGTFGYSSVDKTHCYNIRKMHYLIGANPRFWSYFPANSQLKFEKLNSKCTNQEMSVTTVKKEMNKPSKMLSSSLHRERFKTFPFVSCESRKHETTGSRNCITSINEVTNEAAHAMKKYLGTYGYIDTYQKECVKSKELEINSHNLLSKKYLSVFDTYEKIPLTTDSEDFDKILIVKQCNSVKKKLSEETAVISSEEVHNLLAKSNDILILPEHSKRTIENKNYFLLQDSQTIEPEYCQKIDTDSSYLANEKVEDQNIYLNSENSFPSSSNVFQSVPLPLDSNSFDNKERVLSEGGHCRCSSSANKQKQSEKIHATVQYPSTGSPAVTDTCLQAQAKETVQLSLQGHTQTYKAGCLQPATLKQHLEYVEEQEDINDEQMHIANESQCETVMNDLIMSYSEDESKTVIAADEKLKMHLSVMNNGCIEDVKDKHLPLENKITYKFGLKRKFALVLEELHMFHEISKGNENNLSSLETNSHNYCELSNSEGIDGNVTSVSPKKICISSPICDTIEGQSITNSNGSSLNQKVSNKNEDHKVSKEYSISRSPSEECLHSPIAEGYFDAAYKKPYAWNTAFLSCTLLNEQNYNLQEGGYFLSRDVIRVQPLKTCKGPIRIGLSRKARPKQLHPYLK